MWTWKHAYRESEFVPGELPLRDRARRAIAVPVLDRGLDVGDPGVTPVERRRGMMASEVLLAGRCKGRFRYRRSVIFRWRVRDEEIPYWPGHGRRMLVVDDS